MDTKRLYELLIKAVNFIEEKNIGINRSNLFLELGLSREEIEQLYNFETSGVIHDEKNDQYRSIGSIAAPDGREVVLGYDGDENNPIPYISWIQSSNGNFEEIQYLGELDSKEALIHLFNRAANENGFNLALKLDEIDKINHIEDELINIFPVSEFTLLKQNDQFMKNVLDSYYKLDYSFENEQLVNEIESVYKKMVKAGKFLPYKILNELNEKECSIVMNTYNEIKGKFGRLENKNDVFLLSHDDTLDVISIDKVREISCQNKIVFLKDPTRSIYSLTIELTDGQNYHEIKAENTNYLKLKENMSDIVLNYFKEHQDEMNNKYIDIFDINTEFTVNGEYKDSDDGFMKIKYLDNEIEVYSDVKDAMEAFVVDFNEEILISENNDSVNVYLIASDELVGRLKAQLSMQNDNFINKIENINFYAEYDFNSNSVAIIGDCYVCNEYLEFELLLNDFELFGLMNQIESQFNMKYGKSVSEWACDNIEEKIACAKQEKAECQQPQVQLSQSNDERLS